MLTTLLCQLLYPAIPQILFPLIPHVFIILYITTYASMFVNPRGVEPRAPSLCWWHPTWFLLYTTVFSSHYIAPLPLVCLSPPFQPLASGSHPAALPNPRPCPASRPPPLAALPRRSSCPTRRPGLHAPSTPASRLSSERRQPSSFPVHSAWFYKTSVARAHPCATWPPLNPPSVLHSILAVIALFNSVTRHFQFRGLRHYFPILSPSTTSNPTAQRPFQVFHHLVLPKSHPSHVIEPIRWLHFTISNFRIQFLVSFPDPAHLNRSD